MLAALTSCVIAKPSKAKASPYSVSAIYNKLLLAKADRDKILSESKKKGYPDIHTENILDVNGDSKMEKIRFFLSSRFESNLRIMASPKSDPNCSNDWLFIKSCMYQSFCLIADVSEETPGKEVVEFTFANSYLTDKEAVEREALMKLPPEKRVCGVAIDGTPLFDQSTADLTLAPYNVYVYGWSKENKKYEPFYCIQTKRKYFSDCPLGNMLKEVSQTIDTYNKI